MPTNIQRIAVGSAHPTKIHKLSANGKGEAGRRS
jgi:hypothetical protein